MLDHPRSLTLLLSDFIRLSSLILGRGPPAFSPLLPPITKLHENSHVYQNDLRACQIGDHEWRVASGGLSGCSLKKDAGEVLLDGGL